MYCLLKSVNPHGDLFEAGAFFHRRYFWMRAYPRTYGTPYQVPRVGKTTLSCYYFDPSFSFQFGNNKISPPIKSNLRSVESYVADFIVVLQGICSLLVFRKRIIP